MPHRCNELPIRLEAGRHRGDVSESGEATCTAAAASLRGYDEPSNGRFRLAYVGTLWTLTSVGPLVQSLEQLAAQHPELARRLEVVFAGRRTGAQNKLIDRILELSCHVQQQPYLEHGRAIDLMRRSDGLCLLLSDVPHANRIVPAKVFEYMAARKPILAIAPDGEVSDILADCPHARICRPSDTNRIVQVLSEFIDQCEDGMCEDGMCEEDGSWKASHYERRNLAGELATMLDSVSSPLNSEPVASLSTTGSGERLECIPSSH